MNLLCLDLETTSPDPETARIVQVGLVAFRLDTDPEIVLEELVDPGVEIPSEASKVHGITDGMVWRKPTWAQRWPEIQDWLARADVLVTYNGSHFDLRVVEAELMRAGLPGPIWPEQIDVFNFVDWFHRTKRRSLSAMAALYGVELSEADAHGAGADARATAQLLQQMIRLEWGSSPSVEEVVDLSSRLGYKLRLERSIWGKLVFADRVTGQLCFGIKPIAGFPVSRASELDFLGRAAIRRAIEAGDAPPEVCEEFRSFATPEAEWEEFGRVLVRDPAGRPCLALGRFAGRPTSEAPRSYLRMILEEWGNLTPSTRAELERWASPLSEWQRFGIWLFNDTSGHLCLGAGQHAGCRLSEVPGRYLNGMRRWSDPPTAEVLKLVGWELGRRRRLNSARAQARG